MYVTYFGKILNTKSNLLYWHKSMLWTQSRMYPICYMGVDFWIVGTVEYEIPTGFVWTTSRIPHPDRLPDMDLIRPAKSPFVPEQDHRAVSIWGPDMPELERDGPLRDRDRLYSALTVRVRPIAEIQTVPDPDLHPVRSITGIIRGGETGGPDWI